jgi:hypothetical protein
MNIKPDVKVTVSEKPKTYVITMTRDMARAGGFARAASMTKAERSMSAQRAAYARWGKPERRTGKDRRRKKRSTLERRGLRH